MKKKTVELLLSSGWWVKLRPIPPVANQGAMSKKKFQYPPPPRLDVKTLAGTETVPALEDSPEAIEYYNTCREIDDARDRFGAEFAYRYGVLGWSEDNATWTDVVPSDWELDPVLEEDLEHIPESQKVQFFCFEVMLSPDDFRDVNNVFYSADMTPIEGGEVQAAVDSFQGDVQEEAAE